MWKLELEKFEQDKDWDSAIQLMQKVIELEPNNLDAYLSMNYLLMNLLVEEDHDESRHDYYEELLKKYFKESWAKFYNNTEYLYYTGRTAYMSEWYFDVNLNLDDAREMLNTALKLDPTNLVYQWTIYSGFDERIPENKNISQDYAKMILDPYSGIEQELKTKGSLGEYILNMMKCWAKNILAKNQALKGFEEYTVNNRIKI